ncbi:MAG: hypothetical protein JNM94_01405 [Phycisphaerae bacterium]|nr:hypothetical protein [Phycisphaerae bacterium]
MIAHLASRSEVSLVSWDEAAPGFHIEAIGKINQPVVAVFTEPSVRYVGSHEGCGCGFRNVWGALDGDSRTMTPEEFRQGEPEDPDVASSTAALVKLLRSVVERDGRAEVYACWDGDQAYPAVDSKVISLAELSAERFFLMERRLIIVEAWGSAPEA